MQHLAALRLQYLHGDGAGRAGWNLGSVYPIGRLRNRILHSTKPGVGASGGAGGGGPGDGKGTVGGQGGVPIGVEKRKTPSFLDGTLRRSFKTGSLKKQKVSGGSQVLHNVEQNERTVKTVTEEKRCLTVLTHVAAGGGGADVGDVGQGGDVSHTNKCSGEVDPAAGHASASGHA